MNPQTPRRKVRFGPLDIVVERRTDGAILVRSTHALGPYAERMTDRLDHWARHASYRTFLAERDSRGHWRNVTYAEAQYLAWRIGQALLNRRLSVERPVLILSDNGIEHALLGIGAMYAGIPYSPIAPAHSLLSADFAVLRYIFKLMTPGLVFASDGKNYERALRAVMPEDSELVVNDNPLPGATSFADLVNTEPEGAIEAAHAHVHANTIFKILFTPGSTGVPKGTINTHRMWASNQEMLRHCCPFLAAEPPVLVSGLPWSNTFGGNADVGVVLYNGGSLYIDGGKPAPGEFDETLHNLRAIAPTMYGNKALEVLIPYLRNDAEFRKHFFSRLRFFQYAGAGFSQQVCHDLAEISAAECGESIPFLTGMGSTETAPHALFGLRTDQPGMVGVPAPGVELKLVPCDGAGQLEARFRGPNVTFGYWRRLDLTRAVFDEEGFCKTGDNLRFVDEREPARGFVLDGVDRR